MQADREFKPDRDAMLRFREHAFGGAPVAGADKRRGRR
jgi:hypothetical protein